MNPAAIPFPPQRKSEPAPLLEKLMTFEELVAILGVSRRTCERLVTGGHLRPVKIGAATRFDPADIRRYIDSQKGPELSG
jgi:excisionase family DNA binding protein